MHRRHDRIVRNAPGDLVATPPANKKLIVQHESPDVGSSCLTDNQSCSLESTHQLLLAGSDVRGVVTVFDIHLQFLDLHAMKSLKNNGRRGARSRRPALDPESEMTDWQPTTRILRTCNSASELVHDTSCMLGST